MPSALKTWGLGLERGAKSFFRAGLRLALPARAPSPDPADGSGTRRILVVRQDSRLGNLLLLTPLLRALRDAYPQAETDVLISQAYGEVLGHNPFIHQLWVLPQEVVWPDPTWPFRLYARLRRLRYDVVFDASHMHAFSLTSALASALAGARRRIGFQRGDAELFLDRLVPAPALPLHETEILLHLVRDTASWARLPAPGVLKPEYFMTPEEKEEGRRLWRGWGADASTIAVFLGARGSKRWDTERFLELAGELGREGRKTVLFGGPAEGRLLSGRALPAGAVAAPQLPLRTFAAAIANASAVVTADTGPMHLAVAVGTPTVEIFMNSDAWRFGYAHLPGNEVVDAKGRTASLEEVLAALRKLERPR